MKTKDLVYIGVISVLAYLLLKRKSSTQLSANTSNSGNTSTSGNASNGGLNLGSNMDLPNLTPTPENGLSTEVALNNSNVTPLVKDDNEPTQVFGSYNLPTPYTGGSIISPSPIDVLPVTTMPYPNASTTTQPIVSTSAYPTASTIEFETVGTTTIPNTTSTTSSNIPKPTVVEQVPLPIYAPIPPKLIVAEPVKDELISQCGNSFSIPNNDKEGSYTNYWFDGETYFMQTTSPFMKTVATKITKDSFVDGCKKLQSYQLKNN
jgi:hypothetical protein